MRMHRSCWICATLVVAALAGSGAMAQQTSNADTRSKAYRDVAKACTTDVAKFCPGADQAAMVPRDRVMCLKMFKPDLSPDCRGAMASVAAAAQQSQ